MHALKPPFAAFAALLALIAVSRAVAADAPAPATPAPTTQPDRSGIGIETIVIFRHGEKPPTGLGNLTPQGLNRALALSTVLPQKFGKPDYLFAPDPQETVHDKGGAFNYVRPLITIEPTAIALGMPVQTPCGYSHIDQLNAELSKPQYANALVFVAWEHVYAQRAAADLLKTFGGNPAEAPEWPGKDYDSLYIVKITRTGTAPPTATFTHDHESLDGQSTTMPVPAAK